MLLQHSRGWLILRSLTDFPSGGVSITSAVLESCTLRRSVSPRPLTPIDLAQAGIGRPRRWWSGDRSLDVVDSEAAPRPGFQCSRCSARSRWTNLTARGFLAVNPAILWPSARARYRMSIHFCRCGQNFIDLATPRTGHTCATSARSSASSSVVLPMVVS